MEFRQWLGQAIKLANQGRYGEAVQILEELRETHQESASVHSLLGNAFWMMGDLPRAVHSFGKAAELSPKSELASLGLFHTLMQAGDKQSAVQEMNRFQSVTDSLEYKDIARNLKYWTAIWMPNEETMV